MKHGKGIKEVLSALLAVICSLALYRLLGSLILPSIENAYLKDLAGQLVFCTLAVSSAVILRKTEIFHSDREKLKKGWLSAGLFIVIILLSFLMGFASLFDSPASGMEIFCLIVQMLLVGITEETLFRGLMQNAFHTYFGEDTAGHVAAAAVMTGVVFGTAHLTNALRPGVSLAAAATQAAVIIFNGIYFAAIYFRTGKNLWYVSLIHGLYDLGALLASGRLYTESTDQVLNSAADLPLIGVLIWAAAYTAAAVIALRPKKLNPLLDPEKKPA